MTILWIYHSEIDPQVGGTERATYSVMSALEATGHRTAGFLVFQQEQPVTILDSRGEQVNDLYSFLRVNDVGIVINQIGYSKWLLEEFLARGGRRWKEEGGRIVSCLHFDPEMFAETASALMRNWGRKTPMQKLRRLARVALLPLARRRAALVRNEAYRYVIENSDRYVILSEAHRQKLYDLSRTPFRDRVEAIANPNTYRGGSSPHLIANKRKIVLIVSRLDEPQKRISLALRAWALVARLGEFEEWTLKVIGEGDYEEDYRELVSKKQIPNVEFIGRTDPEPYYEEASIYLHTAKREGWGLTVTEAMQKGVVPVVMNSCAVFAELIEHGRNGILSKDGSVKDLSANIALLMGDANRRRRMAECAMATAARRDPQEIIGRWSAIVAPMDAPTGGTGRP